MTKNLKNYTTTVPVERTVSQIESLLVSIGASHIEKEFQNGQILSLIFTIPQGNGSVKVKLPARYEEAYHVVKKIPEYRNKKQDWLAIQTMKIAWRILLNWIEVEVAMLQIRNSNLLQIFLPYLYDAETGKTFFEKLEESKYKMLTEYK